MLYFTRHAERMDFVHPYVEGESPWHRHDTPLSPLGHTQATEVGLHLAQQNIVIHRILCSPYRRCIQTAARIAMAFQSTSTTGSCGLISIEYACSEWHRQWAPNRLPQHVPSEVISELELPLSLLDTDYKSALPPSYFEQMAQQESVISFCFIS